MKIHHLRNATMIMTIGEHRLLVDPMLSAPASFPGFKLFGGGRQKNPLVALPPEADAALDTVTDVLITHEHPDHLDPAAIRWISERNLPVWAGGVDAPNLEKKGLIVEVLRNGSLGMAVERIPARHGRVLIGWMMGPVSGFFLAHPEEPSIYLTSDAVMSDTVVEAIDRLQPDLIIAPAGAANFGAFGDILFSVDELLTLIKRAPGAVILNHLESLDHCPTTRRDLRERVRAEGLDEKVHIPEDGEELSFERRTDPTHAPVHSVTEGRPGFQKWLTSYFTGT